MTTPLVSVCIPTYNGARYLRETLESVLNQSYRSIQIVVSDDNSVDKTRDIVDELRDERFTIIHHTRSLGAEANWNAACTPAAGTYLKLLCQDDLLLPDCLERQVEILESNASASFVWSPRDVISPGGRSLLKSRGYRPRQPSVTLADVARDVVRSGTNPFGEPCAVLMRKSAFDSTNGFHGSYVIDLNMWIDLLRSGSATFLNRTLSQFRISASSWTSTLRTEHSRQVSHLAGSLVDEFPALISPDDLRIGHRRAARLQRQRTILISMIRLLRF